MKRIIATLAIVFAFALAPSESKAVPFMQAYREMQYILYFEYGGSGAGWSAADWYLQSMYGCTAIDIMMAYSNGYDGSVECLFMAF